MQTAEEVHERGGLEALSFDHVVVDEPPHLTAGGADGDVLVAEESLVPFSCSAYGGPLLPLPTLAAEQALVDADELAPVISSLLDYGLELGDLLHLFFWSHKILRS